MDLIQKGAIPERDLRISNESMEKMNDTIFNSINSVVGTDDNLVIVGDFCFAKKEEYFKKASEYRDRINCSNVFLILGNHDNLSLKPLFTACYDQYMFNINGHKIFCCHYPCRSWPNKGYGTIHLSGHVHGLYLPEQIGQLMPFQKKVCTEGFKNILKTESVEDPTLIQRLLDVIASTNGVDLALDVGVDCRKNVPFGTPWSLDDILEYMKPKKIKFELMKETGEF